MVYNWFIIGSICCGSSSRRRSCCGSGAAAAGIIVVATFMVHIVITIMFIIVAIIITCTISPLYIRTMQVRTGRMCCRWNMLPSKYATKIC